MSEMARTQSDELWDNVLRGGGSILERQAHLIEIANSVQLGIGEVNEALLNAVPMEEWQKRESLSGFLSDAAVLLSNMVDMLQARSDCGLKLQLVPARAHRPTDWSKRKARASVDNRAARLVERLVRADWQQERAVRHVAMRKRSPSTRDRIFAALKVRKSVRKWFPDAPEHVLLSWLVEGVHPT